MISDDERDIAMQFPAAPPVEQIRQAVVVSRDEDGHARALGRQFEAPVHTVPFGQRRELVREVLQRQVEPGKVPLYAHEKQAVKRVLMLIGVKDIRVTGVEEVRDRGDKSLAIRTVDQQHSAVVHRNIRAITEPGRVRAGDAGAAAERGSRAPFAAAAVSPADCFIRGRFSWAASVESPDLAADAR